MVEFASPVLVLPVHPLSPSHIEADLGKRWTLQNRYEWIDPRSGAALPSDAPVSSSDDGENKHAASAVLVVTHLAGPHNQS
jgi:hypothetical protein